MCADNQVLTSDTVPREARKGVGDGKTQWKGNDDVNDNAVPDKAGEMTNKPGQQHTSTPPSTVSPKRTP